MFKGLIYAFLSGACALTCLTSAAQAAGGAAAEQSTCDYLAAPNPAAVTCYTQTYGCANHVGCVAISCTFLYVYKAIDLSYLASRDYDGDITTVPVKYVYSKSRAFQASNSEIGGELPASLPLAASEKIAAQLTSRLMWEANTFIAQDAALQCAE